MTVEELIDELKRLSDQKAQVKICVRGIKAEPGRIVKESPYMDKVTFIIKEV